MDVETVAGLIEEVSVDASKVLSSAGAGGGGGSVSNDLVRAVGRIDWALSSVGFPVETQL